MDKNRLESVLYFLIYVCGGVFAGYHTFQINVLYNPPWIALVGAIAVDLLLAYTLHSVRKWVGDKKFAAMACIVIFLVVSSAAQVLYQQLALQKSLTGWALWMATYVIPIASGPGSVAAIALIQFFDNAATKVSAQQGISTAVEIVPKTETEPWVEAPPAEMITGNGNGHVEVIKRKPGRPPKVAFAKDMELPKALKKP